MIINIDVCGDHITFFGSSGLVAVLQLAFQGRGVADRALFARSYKTEGTMCHVRCSVSTLSKIFSSQHAEIFFLIFPENSI